MIERWNSEMSCGTTEIALRRLCLRDARDVLAVDGDAAVLSRRKTAAAARTGWISPTGLAYQPDPLARLRRRLNLVQYLQAAGITERNLVENDRRPRSLPAVRLPDGHAVRAEAAEWQ